MDAHTAENDNSTSIADKDYEIAIRRSMLETTREEALFADALRASVLSRDEELARSMQRKFNLEHTSALNQAPEPPSETWHYDIDHEGVLQARQTPHFTYTAAVKNNATINTSNPNDKTAQEPWLVARSRGRLEPVKPQMAVSPPTPAPTLVSRPTVHRVVPPLPKLMSNTSVARPAPTSIHDGGNGNATLGSPVTPASVVVQKKPRVVLDGMNVGCALIGGGGHRFRSRAVFLALEYYRARGVYAVALLPQNKVDNSLGYSALADNVKLLTNLHEQKRVFFTPPGASDDNFILTYAINAQADLVSNDRFRFELGRQRGTEAAKKLKAFLRKHLVPFTFILEEFTPNPHPESLCDHVHYPRDRGYR